MYKAFANYYFLYKLIRNAHIYFLDIICARAFFDILLFLFDKSLRER